jgi:hypothetical protein
MLRYALKLWRICVFAVTFVRVIRTFLAAVLRECKVSSSESMTASLKVT